MRAQLKHSPTAKGPMRQGAKAQIIIINSSPLRLFIIKRRQKHINRLKNIDYCDHTDHQPRASTGFDEGSQHFTRARHRRLA